MFTFPVLTYSLLYRDGKFVDENFARWCSDHNTTWNDSNFFISGDVNTLSNCCRLLSDTSKLNAFINSIGGTALSIGSVKVNTINLMRIALETECDEKKFWRFLKSVRCCAVKLLIPCGTLSAGTSKRVCFPTIRKARWRWTSSTARWASSVCMR